MSTKNKKPAKKKPATTGKPSKPSKPTKAEPLVDKPKPEAVTPDVKDSVEPVDKPGARADVPVEADAVPDAAQEAAVVPEAPEAEPAAQEPTAAPAGPLVPPLRDPRLPPVGSTITRQYKGAVIEVKVLETGFELAGEVFSSISKAAAAATGNRTAALNGYAFFKLGVIPGGKAPGRGTSARLVKKIARIEGLAVKLRDAVEAGQAALAEAEGDVAALKEKAEQIPTLG